jgi:hypothetical protein
MSVIHKTYPKKNGGGRWVFKSRCGAKLPKKKPYSISSTLWRLVTCEECIKTREAGR